jgi:hypothetical protein
MYIEVEGKTCQHAAGLEGLTAQLNLIVL